MPYKIGLVGKPSVGKSTFFNAATEAHADEGDYPFTTIEPNVGEAYVSIDCAAPEFDTTCDPSEGYCTEGRRFVPVKLVDVAGLIPGAHEGKGLGNKFLSDLNEVDVLIHVVDFSGNTDEEGEPTENHDPMKDIHFLTEELDEWYFDVVKKGIEKFERKRQSGEVKPEEVLASQLSAFKLNKHEIKSIINECDIPADPSDWSEDEIKSFASSARKESKPMIIAANKMDIPGAQDNLESVKSRLEENWKIVECSARAEKILQKAADKGLIEYRPGDKDFSFKSEIDEDKKKSLKEVKQFVNENKGTGVQESLNTALFEELGVKAVFPGGTNGLEDSHGNTLPDCFLLPEDATAEDFAFEIHQDIGEGFLKALDVRTEREVGADQKLDHRDVIEIVSSN